MSAQVKQQRKGSRATASAMLLDHSPPDRVVDRETLLAQLDKHQATSKDGKKAWLDSLRTSVNPTGWTSAYENGDLLTSISVDIWRTGGKDVSRLLSSFQEAVEDFHIYHGPTAWRLDQCSSEDS